MEDKPKGKNKEKLILVIVTVLLLMAVFYFAIYRPVIRYTDTHTWATIQIMGEVVSETSDAFEERREFLKGDTYQLHSTTVTIEDITNDGKIKLKFQPAVKSADTGELIQQTVIGKDEVLNIKEVCGDGASASWQLRVISSRYQ